MGKSCRIIPRVKNEKGAEANSLLFQDLVRITGNREASISMWAMSKTNEFRSLIDESANTDQNGEPDALFVLDKLGVSSAVKERSIAYAEKELGAVDKNRRLVEFDNGLYLINKLVDFNKSRTHLVATPSKIENGKYIIEVSENKDLGISKGELERTQKLNNAIMNTLRNLGFSVKIDDDAESKGYTGIFNPLEAKRNAEGLLDVISIAKGQKGQEALPEEFAHLIVEGMQNSMHIERSLNLLRGNLDLIKEILGEDFQTYMKLYNGNTNRLAKEALGKVLASYIIENKGSGIVPTTLLGRVWANAKDRFSKASQSQINEIFSILHEEASFIADRFNKGTLIPLIDTSDVAIGEALYKTERADQAFKRVEALAEKGRNLLAAKLAQQRNGTSSIDKQYKKNDLVSLANLKSNMEKMEFLGAIVDVVTNASSEVGELMTSVMDLEKNTKDGIATVEDLREAANILRRIKEVSDAYTELMSEYSGAIAKEARDLNESKDRDDINLANDLSMMIPDIMQINELLNSLNHMYKSMSTNVVANYLSMFWNGAGIESEETDPQARKDDIEKKKLLAIQQMLERADKDIGIWDRWLTSMAMSSDRISSIIAATISMTQLERDRKINEVQKEIRQITMEYGGDTSFMYELGENGIPTGRYISDIDWKSYYRNRKEAYERIKAANNGSPSTIHEEYQKWINNNTIEVQPDPNSTRKERIPGNAYRLKGTKNPLSRLSQSQKRYYERMMGIKARMDSLLPEGKGKLYNTPMIRKDWIEIINSDNLTMGQKATILMKNYRDSFVKIESDTEFGDPNDGLFNIELGIDGRPIKRIPVYYTSKINDLRLLTTDASFALDAYASMAVNFGEMDKISDLISITSDVLSKRLVQQQSGGKNVAAVSKVLGMDTKRDYVEKGGEAFQRIMDFIDSNVYGIHKKDEGTFKIGKYHFDKAKTLDKIKSAASVISLSTNLSSAVSNVVMGKIQMMIEAAAGEFFNWKDFRFAEAEWTKLSSEAVAQAKSNKRTAKLFLLMDKFNVGGNFYGESSNNRYYQDLMQRLMSSDLTFLMHSSGEIWLTTTALVSTMHNYKVMVDGKESNLYEAYEVKETKNSAGKVIRTDLVLKKNVTKMDGTPFTEENKFSGKLNEQGSDLARFSMRAKRVSHKMNGAFNTEDKGAIHKYALGRLVMQFRQWMPEHFSRRFASKYYDEEIGSDQEGYYRTLVSKLYHGMIQREAFKEGIAKYWHTFTPHEQANMKRALFELSAFTIISLLAASLGSFTDHKHNWAARFLIYQINRAQLELGASIPSPAFFQNVKTVINSPVAAMKVADVTWDLVNLWSLFQTVETGPNAGENAWLVNNSRNIPYFSNLKKVWDIDEDPYMFAVFNKK